MRSVQNRLLLLLPKPPPAGKLLCLCVVLPHIEASLRSLKCIAQGSHANFLPQHSRLSTADKRDDERRKTITRPKESDEKGTQRSAGV